MLKKVLLFFFAETLVFCWPILWPKLQHLLDILAISLVLITLADVLGIKAKFVLVSVMNIKCSIENSFYICLLKDSQRFDAITQRVESIGVALEFTILVCDKLHCKMLLLQLAAKRNAFRECYFTENR